MAEASALASPEVFSVMDGVMTEAASADQEARNVGNLCHAALDIVDTVAWNDQSEQGLLELCEQAVTDCAAAMATSIATMHKMQEALAELATLQGLDGEDARVKVLRECIASARDRLGVALSKRTATALSEATCRTLPHDLVEGFKRASNTAAKLNLMTASVIATREKEKHSKEAERRASTDREIQELRSQLRLLQDEVRQQPTLEAKMLPRQWPRVALSTKY